VFKCLGDWKMMAVGRHDLSRDRRRTMSGQDARKVLLRGPTDGDVIVLPMGGLEARIVRKASRTETGGHWAVGEAWPDPNFDNPPHTHDEAEAFYVLEGTYTFYTDDEPAEGIGPRHLRVHPAGRGARLPCGPCGRATPLRVAVDGRGRILRRSQTERYRLRRRAVNCECDERIAA
jgi:hypothetical protein